MAERQKSELQSVFEANILKSQGQNSVLNRMEDIGEIVYEIPSEVVNSEEPLLLQFSSGNDTVAFNLR